MQPEFDPQEKEDKLREESQSWDTSVIEIAREGDVPVIDVGAYFTSGSTPDLEKVADALREACLHVGFFALVGHGFQRQRLEQVFNQAKAFFELPREIKDEILMDRPDWSVKGVGYLPMGNRKLPTRSRGNLNEAIVIKRDHVADLEHNQWPEPDHIPGFREAVTAYAKDIEALALKLVPIFAKALDLDPGFFDDAFTRPTYRLRMTRYPPVKEKEADEFGIAPHVDTTFFTLLAQDSPGLVIYSERRRCWIYAPMVENAFIVNTGELLRQWTNDTFISVKHFANNNTSGVSRYSVPFFFNANADYKMECLPTCCSEENPPKYPPLSYLESQAVAQGE